MSRSGFTATAVLILLFSLISCGSADSFLSNAGLPSESAVVVDPAGDVRDVDGERPPGGSNSADIIKAGIHVSDADLILAIEQTVPVSSGLEEIDWTNGVGEWLNYTLFIADTRGTIDYMLLIGLAGSKWSANVYDSRTGDSIELDEEPNISESILTYRFPRALLTDLQTPFKWAVGSEWAKMDVPNGFDRMAYGDQVTEDDSDGWTGYPYMWVDYPK